VINFIIDVLGVLICIQVVENLYIGNNYVGQDLIQEVSDSISLEIYV